MLIPLLISCASETECEACAGECLRETIPSPSAAHVEGGVDYADVPPTGGDHDPCWAEWGVHAEEVPDERWVHNLEHGGVVFLWNCPEGCPGEQAELEGLSEDLGAFTLVSPYAALPTRFAAVAWEQRLLVDCLEVEVFRDFFNENVNRAPESVSAGPSDGCMP